jgi:hypothetical protein
MSPGFMRWRDRSSVVVEVLDQVEVLHQLGGLDDVSAMVPGKPGVDLLACDLPNIDANSGDDFGRERFVEKPRPVIADGINEDRQRGLSGFWSLVTPLKPIG